MAEEPNSEGKQLPTAVTTTVFALLALGIGAYVWTGIQRVEQEALAEAKRAAGVAATKQEMAAEPGTRRGMVRIRPADKRGELYRALPQRERVFEVDPAHEAGLQEPPHASPQQPTIVLAVMDTVRADHTSLCAYGRDTTPYLASLAEAGASHSCRAYSPGDWSLPSHASYFTGLPVHGHGAHHAFRDATDAATRVDGEGALVYPLREGVETLAETLGKRGYQTVLISANTLLGRGGLQRGFAIKGIKPTDFHPAQDWVGPTLQRLLAGEVDAEKPLFVVLNFLEAHDPWVGPPADLGWQDLLDPQMHPESFTQVFMPTIGKATPPPVADMVTRQLVDLYDYGVLREDRALRRAMGVLKRAGWLDAKFRVVVTADHGELLNEHGAWRHSFIYESSTRVPFLYWTDGDAPALPSPLSGIVAYHLLRDGALPSPMPRPHSIAIPNPDMEASNSRGGDPRHLQPAVAMWDGDDKLSWMAGEYFLTNVANDPGDDAPAPLEEHPLRGEIESLVKAVQATRAERRGPAAADDDLVQQLKALGYTK